MSEINIYSPRILVAALNQVIVPKRFLLANFFKSVVPHDTEKVDIDIKKGNRNVAVFVNPIANGHLVEDAGYETVTVKPGYTKELKTITPNDTVKRLFGEDYTVPLSPRQREQRLLGEKLVDLETRIMRAEEVMAAQALVHGEVILKGVKMDHKVSFGYELGKHKIILSGASCWDQSGSDPMFDLDDWSDGISERSGLAPNMIICGKKALRALIDNEKVQKRLDIRNYHVGQIDIGINQELAEQGVIYHGMLAPSNIPIYTYNEKYFNETTQKVEPLIPDDVVLMGSTSAGCQMLYGLIQNLNALTSIPRFPWSWVEDNGSARYIQLESAPLPNLYQVDAFVSAKVL